MRTRLLRSMLMGNAGFSLACGSAMFIEPEWVSRSIGWTGPNIWAALAILLALFAIGLGATAIPSRPQALAAVAACIGDFLWVIGTAALAFLSPSLMSETGWQIATVVATIVLFFGLGQYAGVDRMYRASPRRHRLDLDFAVTSSIDEFWPLLADLSRISEFADGLSESRVTKTVPAMIGTTRVCSDNDGNKWRETVTGWQPGVGFDLEFDADASDFPFPFSSMTGGWRLANDGPNLRVGVYWIVVLKRPWLAALLLPLMEWKVGKDMAKTVAAIDHMAQINSTAARQPVAPAA